MIDGEIKLPAKKAEPGANLSEIIKRIFLEILLSPLPLLDRETGRKKRSAESGERSKPSSAKGKNKNSRRESIMAMRLGTTRSEVRGIIRCSSDKGMRYIYSDDGAEVVFFFCRIDGWKNCWKKGVGNDWNWINGSLEVDGSNECRVRVSY